MKTFDEFVKISQCIPFLSCISKTGLEEIYRVLIVKKFTKNQVILLEKEQSDFFYIIFSGKVKVTQQNEAGKELLLAIHKRGHYFGEMSMMDGKTSPSTIIAAENSKIGFITRANFERYIIGNEKSFQQLVAVLCSRLRYAWSTLKMYSYADAADRIRTALNVFYRRFGLLDDRGKVIHLKLTHRDLANYAAISRETASRIISSLIKSEEIEIVDNKYYLLKPAFFKKDLLLSPG